MVKTMRYFISPNNSPLIHISSGELQSNDRFIHSRGNFDSFEIILCIKGTLYLSQNGKQFILKPNHFIILFAGEEHHGYRESEGGLSYFWCHFQTENNNYKLITEEEKNTGTADAYSGWFFLPETGSVTSDNRVILLFKQLLDICMNCYSEYFPNYALSLLAMEISQKQIEQNHNFVNGKKLNSNFEAIIDWIQVNYNQRFSGKKIAGLFNYNSDYLASRFKKYCGISLMKYISKVRIGKAKELLLQSNKSVKEIAYDVGFSDVKLFLKRFKQLAGITPTKYRDTFFRKKIVK